MAIAAVNGLGRRLWAGHGWIVFLAVLACTLMGCGSKSGESANQPASEPPAEAALPTQAIEISGKAFELELALDDDSRFKGLSLRKEIPEDGGMLFVFPKARPAQFVMRQCYVPIDLIYVDAAGYIDSIHRMSVIEPIGGPEWEDPSGGYESRGAVQFVIELKGGTLDQLDLRPGKKIDLPRRELQSRAQ